MSTKSENDLVREIESLSDTMARRDDALRQKLDKLDERVDRAEKIMARPNRNAGAAGSGAADERDRTAVREALREGCADVGPLRALQNMSTAIDPAGGFAVIPFLSGAVMDRKREMSPLRSVARTVSISTGDAFEELGEEGELEAEWVSERAARPKTGTPTFRKISIPVASIYCAPGITQNLIDDNAIGLETWLADAIGRRFARAEGQAFVTGNGVGRPRGFTTFPTAPQPDATRAGQTFQDVATGVSGGFASTNPADVLMDCVELLHPDYRPRAVWAMRRATFSTVRKLKTTGGEYLLDTYGIGFAPPGLGDAPARATVSGRTAMLLGHPVLLLEDMPAIGANSLAIAFGDFSRGYTIVDRAGIRLLSDPFTDRPNVVMHAWQRVGGGVSDFDAIKFIRFGT